MYRHELATAARFCRVFASSISHRHRMLTCHIVNKTNLLYPVRYCHTTVTCLINIMFKFRKYFYTNYWFQKNLSDTKKRRRDGILIRHGIFSLKHDIRKLLKGAFYYYSIIRIKGSFNWCLFCAFAIEKTPQQDFYIRTVVPCTVITPIVTVQPDLS